MTTLQQERRERLRLAALERRLAARTEALARVSEELRVERARRQQLEEQCLQGQKMEALGRLTAGVAHDFNNLLTVILGYADVLRQYQPQPAARACLDELTKSAERAAELTRRLVAFGRKQPPAVQAVDLNARVRDLKGVLERLIGDHIKIATELDESVAPVRVDPIQVDQVLLNLAVNARDAMPQGGVLTIATENRPGGGGGDLASGPVVMLTVRDTGCGIDDATRGRIFEPFFTTKEAGRGAGLGLATVGEIVRTSGGRVSVASQPGEGTAFHVFFPGVVPG